MSLGKSATRRMRYLPTPLLARRPACSRGSVALRTARRTACHLQRFARTCSRDGPSDPAMHSQRLTLKVSHATLDIALLPVSVDVNQGEGRPGALGLDRHDMLVIFRAYFQLC